MRLYGSPFCVGFSKNEDRRRELISLVQSFDRYSIVSMTNSTITTSELV